MRVVTFAIFVSGFFVMAPAIAASHPSHAVFCESMLVALDNVSGLASSNPIVSLRELQDYLRKSRGYSPRFDLSDVDGYMDQNYFGRLMDASQPAAFKRVLSRLNKLEDDTESSVSSIPRMAVELRGKEAVSRYLQIFQAETADLNTRVSAELSRRYPILRLGNVLAYSSYAFLAASALINLNDTWGSYVMAATIGAFSAAIEFFNQRSNQSGHQVGWSRQMQAVAAGLQDGSNFPISIVSGSVRVPDSFQSALMDIKGSERPPFDLTLALSVAGKIKDSDQVVVALRDVMQTPNELEIMTTPPEPTRALYYDSIFYVDPVTNEPVWLIYYRAFRDRPTGTKSRVPNKAAAQQGWTPGLVPALLPVRAR